MKKPLHRRRAFYIAASAGVAGFLVGVWLAPQLAFTIGADVFFTVYLALVVAGFRMLTPAYLKQNADSADEPAWIIFLVTLATVIIALASLFILINRQERPDLATIVLTLASLPLGWFTIHTMTALHYAHLYWQPETTEEGSTHARRSPRHGLEFPGKEEPGGADFLYFSYVVGMTAQTADVSITNTAMRTVCTIHAVVSFFFNTVLVAAAVNIVVSLGD